MAACTPSIHVFLGRPLFLLSSGTHSIINFGILSSGISWLIISLLYASTCFEHYVLFIRRSKLYYKASGIITPVGDRPVHRLREDFSQPVHPAATNNSKLYYTASGIITPLGGRPVHRLREVFSQPVHRTATKRSKLYYTASDIITPVGDRPVHRLKEDFSQPVHRTATYRCEDTRFYIIQF